jgi:hypothetical protein
MEIGRLKAPRQSPSKDHRSPVAPDNSRLVQRVGKTIDLPEVPSVRRVDMEPARRQIVQ